MKRGLMCVIGMLCVSIMTTSAQEFQGFPRAHTFSIVARDPATGEIGVALESHWFAIGSLCPWAEAGVGAVVTQSVINVSFGPKGLELLRQGKTAQQALDSLIESDEGREFRQVAIIDAQGNVAAWTGKKCIQAAGFVTGKQFAAQGNLLLNDTTWNAMADTFQKAQGSLSDRLIATLEAAQATGGDLRGRQSAAIIVVSGKRSDSPWNERLLDLRVDDHPAPIEELKRLATFDKACKHVLKGDDAVAANDIDEALRQYSAAEALFPEYTEFQFWHAVALANAKRVDESLPIFKEVFKKEPNWRILIERLIPVGILTVTDQEKETIQSLGSGKSISQMKD